MPITALEHLATGSKTRSLLLIMLFRCSILSRMHPKVFTNTSLSIMIQALLIFASLTVACAIPIEAAGQVNLTYSGEVKFKSDAPLELITAASDKLRGAIDTEKRTFAFSIEMNTFEGFNSPLQREHFNENYLETQRYPKATFTGKIIEDLDLTKPGTYEVRAKGTLSIHGIARERIIKSQVRVDENGIHIESYFTVLLEEHDISIPKIVYQKIAEEIEVWINATLTKQ
jgi:polyisoprenoid-binding protein YceI